MTISTLNGVLAGFQPGVFYFKVVTPTMVAGRPQSLWGLAGIPGAGSYNTTINGATYSSSVALVNGQLYHLDPGGGASAYLARFQMQMTTGSGGSALLCDRIWDNQLAINNTSSQAITTPAWPSRDGLGAANGDGILAALEVSAVTSVTSASLAAYTYTNQSGVGSRTGTMIDTTTAAASQPGNFFRLSLQSPDTGIQSIQSIQFNTAWTTGTVSLVAYRILSIVECVVVGSANAADAVTSGFPRLYNGVVPFVVILPASTTATVTTGFYMESQG